MGTESPSPFGGGFKGFKIVSQKALLGRARHALDLQIPVISDTYPIRANAGSFVAHCFGANDHVGEGYLMLPCMEGEEHHVLGMLKINSVPIKYVKYAGKYREICIFFLPSVHGSGVSGTGGRVQRWQKVTELPSEQAD